MHTFRNLEEVAAEWGNVWVVVSAVVCGFLILLLSLVALMQCWTCKFTELSSSLRVQDIEISTRNVPNGVPKK